MAKYLSEEKYRLGIGEQAGPPIIHEAITQNPDPMEFMPIEVNSAFPAGAKSILSPEEQAKVDALIEDVPDKNDTMAINYWVDMEDKKVYLEGWCDKCLAGTGFPPMGIFGEWDDKIQYMLRDAHRTLVRKEKERGLNLIEGGFREFEAGDRENLYGVTWGVYIEAKNPTVPEAEIPEIPTTIMTMFEPPAKVELPVVNAVSALRTERPVSSGFHTKLGERWAIVFEGEISQKAKDAAKKAFLDVNVRTTTAGTILTDVSLPEVGVTELGLAEEHFDMLAEAYSGKPVEVNLVERWLEKGESKVLINESQEQSPIDNLIKEKLGLESNPPFERLGKGEIANKLLPMPPDSGPPLPRILGLKWPWKE